jgi:hypothetical protein
MAPSGWLTSCAIEAVSSLPARAARLSLRCARVARRHRSHMGQTQSRAGGIRAPGGAGIGNGANCGMSDLGHKRTFAVQKAYVGFTPKADIHGFSQNAC